MVLKGTLQNLLFQNGPRKHAQQGLDFGYR